MTPKPRLPALNVAQYDSGHTKNETLLRVRYSEIDGIGTFYNSRALEWFECGRTELLRSIGHPYTELESMGIHLPVTEAHVEYLSRARYDDLLKITTIGRMEGRARIRCEVEIEQASSSTPIVRGYTIHGFINTSGKPIRPPRWFVEAFVNPAGDA